MSTGELPMRGLEIEDLTEISCCNTSNWQSLG